MKKNALRLLVPFIKKHIKFEYFWLSETCLYPIPHPEKIITTSQHQTKYVEVMILLPLSLRLFAITLFVSYVQRSIISNVWWRDLQAMFIA